MTPSRKRNAGVAASARVETQHLLVCEEVSQDFSEGLWEHYGSFAVALRAVHRLNDKVDHTLPGAVHLELEHSLNAMILV